jgi:calmodulin
MPWAFTPEQLCEIKESFKLYDKDNIGFIGLEEMKIVMRSLGYHMLDEEITELISQVDSDGIGTIDIVEFIGFLARKCREESNEGVSDIMNMFDKDKDGKVSILDLKEVLLEAGESLSDNALNEVFAAYAGNEKYMSEEQLKNFLLAKL